MYYNIYLDSFTTQLTQNERPLLSEEEIDRQIRNAKRFQASGKHQEALRIYEYLRTIVFNDHGAVIDSSQMAVVIHNEASLHALNKQAKAARAAYKASVAKANHPVTAARTLRGYANFVLLNDVDTDEARLLINQAQGELSKEAAKAKLGEAKLRIEKAITNGLEGRVLIVEGDVEKGLAMLRTLDLILEEYGQKPDDQAHNLSWIIDATPDSQERKYYIEKAIRLSSQRGNTTEKRAYQALLLGGEPLMLLTVMLQKNFSLGANTLKAITKRLL